MSNVLSELRGHERTRGRARAIGREALGGGSHAQAHFVGYECHTAGVASWIGGHVRGRARWRALWALAIVLVLSPRLALAEPFFEIERNFADYENNESVYGYVVVDCPSAYQASLLLIDEYSSLVQIDAETYNKLMSSSTGGAFYDLVQEWGAIGPAEGSSQRLYPSWAGDTYYQIGLVGVYGYKRVWAAEVTDTLKASAREDFLAILDGHNVGPGSGGGSGGSGSLDGNDIHLELCENGLDYAADYKSNLTDISDIVVTLNNDYLGLIEDGGICVLCTTSTGYEIWFFDDLGDATREYDVSPDEAVNYVAQFSNDTGSDILFKRKQISISVSVSNGVASATMSNGTTLPTTEQNLAADGSYNCPPIATSSSSSSNKRRCIIGYYDAGTSGTPEPGPNPDPEPTGPEAPDPTAPTPPELPNPGDPVVPDPPDPPDPVTPGSPITYIVNVTTEPTTTDVIDWLRAIYNELKLFHQDYVNTIYELMNLLDTHCIHLQNRMSEVSEYVGGCVQDVSSTVSSGFATLNDYLKVLIQDLMDFIADQSQWLVDNLKFVNNVTVDEYDDTSVLYWLRRIYARLGSGIVNTRPTDPVTQWDPWGEWLQQLVEFILGVLTGGIGGVIGNVVTAISNLSSVFPFCIPFDLLLLMDAITTDPVTPYVSVVMPATDWYDTFTISVDCDVYDDAMEVVRNFELLAFVVYVMLHSKELFGWNASEFSKFWGSGGNA